MNFIDAMNVVFDGGAVRRLDWLSEAGRRLGIAAWYIKMEDGVPFIFHGDKTETVGILHMTKRNFETTDWEVIEEGFETELKKLKQKYGLI